MGGRDLVNMGRLGILTPLGACRHGHGGAPTQAVVEGHHGRQGGLATTHIHFRGKWWGGVFPGAGSLMASAVLQPSKLASATALLLGLGGDISGRSGGMPGNVKTLELSDCRYWRFKEKPFSGIPARAPAQYTALEKKKTWGTWWCRGEKI